MRLFKWQQIKQNNPSLDRALSSNFWWLKSANHIKFKKGSSDVYKEACFCNKKCIYRFNHIIRLNGISTLDGYLMPNSSSLTHTHTHAYIYIERERDRQTDSKRERVREREFVSSFFLIGPELICLHKFQVLLLTIIILFNISYLFVNSLMVSRIAF